MNKPTNPTNPTVIIHIGGGCLRQVISNIANLEYVLIDEDNHSESCDEGECYCDLGAERQDSMEYWETTEAAVERGRMILQGAD